MLNYLDIELPEDARQLQRRVRRFVEEEALPLIPALFRGGALSDRVDPAVCRAGAAWRHAPY